MEEQLVVNEICPRLMHTKKHRTGMDDTTDKTSSRPTFLVIANPIGIAGDIAISSVEVSTKVSAK